MMTDEELQRAFRGSRDNFWLGVLLERYTLLLLGVGIKYLKDKSRAEDAVQHVFEKSLVHFPKKEVINIKGWLYILMRNHCLQLLRDTTYFLPEEYAHHIDESEEENNLQQFSLEQIKDAVLSLNDFQRNCINLFYFQKKSYQQIMEQTGLSFAEVKTHIQNGKRNLKIFLLKKFRQ